MGPSNFGRQICARAGGGHGPRERPAVGVEHWQCPEVGIGRRHRPVRQHSDGVHPRIAVRDHHAFRPRRRAAGVVDGEEIALTDVRPREFGARVGDERFVIQPVETPAIECHEVPHAGEILPDPIDGLEVIRRGAHHRRTAVLNQVAEVIGHQTEIDRHEDSAQLRHRIKRRQLRVRVRRDVRHSIALRDAHALQCGRPAIAAIEEVSIRPSLLAIHDAFAAGIQLPRAAHEFQGGQRSFHWRHSITSGFTEERKNARNRSLLILATF